jgi:hypothetical protein
MPSRKRRDPLAGKRDPSSQLLRAVRRFVESHGGNVLVIGDIQLQRWPEDMEFTWRIAVKCTGRAPQKKFPLAMVRQ